MDIIIHEPQIENCNVCQNEESCHIRAESRANIADVYRVNFQINDQVFPMLITISSEGEPITETPNALDRLVPDEVMGKIIFQHILPKIAFLKKPGQLLH